MSEKKYRNQEPLADSQTPNITAIIVSFEPDIQLLLNNIRLINQQVTHTVLVDNGSSNQQALFENVQRSFISLSIIALSDNMGLGVAHNHGIARAKELGSEYVLLLDQDSQPESDMVEKLCLASRHLRSSEVENNRHAKPLAAVGPRYTGEGREDSFFVNFGWFKFRRQYCAESNDGLIPADFLISSGSMIAIPVLEKIGYMDEGLFIDHVDTEWFLRAKQLGYQSYGVCDAMMFHGLGEKTRTVKLFGLIRKRNVPQHKPFRYYYMFRNSVYLYKKGYSALWMWNDFQRLCQIAIFYGVLYGPRRQNLSMMLQGVKDGFLGRQGKLK